MADLFVEWVVWDDELELEYRYNRAGTVRVVAYGRDVDAWSYTSPVSQEVYLDDCRDYSGSRRAEREDA